MATKKKLCTKLRRAFGKGFTCKYIEKYKVYSLLNKKKECLELELNDDVLTIGQLRKCQDSSGSATMEKIENVARQMGVKSIDLVDGQYLVLECGKKTPIILMKYINILADGESWYNKLGYKSKMYDAEVLHNKRIGQMNAGLFVEKTMNYRKKCPYKRMDYWGPLDVTVKEYFTRIKEELKTDVPTKLSPLHECVKYKWLEYLLGNIMLMIRFKSKSKIKLFYNIDETLSLPL